MYLYALGRKKESVAWIEANPSKNLLILQRNYSYPIQSYSLQPKQASKPKGNSAVGIAKNNINSL